MTKLILEVNSVINDVSSKNTASVTNNQTNSGPKIIESLRPSSKLSYDNNPVELNVWLSQFKNFFEASKLEREAIGVQQCHLTCSLESDVAADLDLAILEDTPIFNDGSDRSIKTCFGAIHEKWLQRYPIHKRRIQLIGSKRPQAMDKSSWINKIRTSAKECYLEELSPDQIITLVICHGIEDNLLQKDLMLLKDKSKDPAGPPTLGQIVEFVENYESVNESTRPTRNRDVGNIGGPRHGRQRSSSRKFRPGS